MVSLATPGSLTLQESSRLRQLEHVIEEGLEGFLKVGKSLQEIRDSRLYRATHDRWADYARDRWALSLSRANQLINSVAVYDTLTTAFPADTTLLAESNEHALRPLAQLEPELQVATWELIRHIEERPDGTTIQETVTAIRDAIAIGWQAHTETPLEADKVEPPEPSHDASVDRNGSTPSSHSRTSPRAGGPLGTFSRWANKLTSWDPAAIAAADDELCMKRHLKAARQLRMFCDAFIQAIEARLAG
jgi:hypothetical protein